MFSSKKITENRCLQRCLDISLDIAHQINTLWEPIQRLVPIFNITTKVDLLVSAIRNNRNLFLSVHL